MLNNIEELQLSVDEAATLRLLQIALLAADADESEPAVRAAKTIALGTLVESGMRWSHEVGRADLMSGLERLDVPKLAVAAVARMPAGQGRDGLGVLLGLELLTTTTLPGRASWAVDRESVVAALIGRVQANAGVDVLRAHKSYRRAAKALATEGTHPGLRLSLAAGAATVTALSGGIATALGTAIGGSMGLSGAAATSAGLAWLGGGSVAAGGFGMAGGSILVAATAKGAYAGGRSVITATAREQSKVVASELAKLCVMCESSPSLSAQAVSRLTELRGEMALESDRTADLNRSQRAVEAAVRRIEDGSGRALRLVRGVNRTLPIPGSNGRVDWLRDRARSDGEI